MGNRRENGVPVSVGVEARSAAASVANGIVASTKSQVVVVSVPYRKAGGMRRSSTKERSTIWARIPQERRRRKSTIAPPCAFMETMPL